MHKLCFVLTKFFVVDKLHISEFLYMYREHLKKTGFHTECYIGTMPRLVQIESCFFWYNSLYFYKIGSFET